MREGAYVVDPVGVEHTKVSTSLADTLFGLGPEGATELEVVDTSVTWLTVHLSLVDWALASSTAHLGAVDDVALLGLVSKTTGLVRAGWARRTVSGRQLTQLPGAYTQKETHHIRLLAVPKLAKVFVGSHVFWIEDSCITQHDQVGRNLGARERASHPVGF